MAWEDSERHISGIISISFKMISEYDDKKLSLHTLNNQLERAIKLLNESKTEN